jgi:hypothetical protein
VINGKKVNVGLEKAEKAQEQLGKKSLIVIPRHEDFSDDETDWNDYLVKFGKEKTIAALAEQGVKVKRIRKVKE